MGYAFKNYKEDMVKEITKIIQKGITDIAYDRSRDVTYEDIAKEIFDVIHPEAVTC